MTGRVGVTFYTRSGCHLCDEAAAELARLAAAHALAIETVDIDNNDATRERYNEIVPAIHVDGVLISSAPLDWTAIRSAIAVSAAPPDQTRR